MATAAPTQTLPLFYQALEPINSDRHGKLKLRSVPNAQMATAYAVPITVDEFALAQRHYPIVFAVGDNPVPIALMGLNEGVNVFFDEAGRPLDEYKYVPAYIRRYPFMLARRRPDSEEMSLCVDPTSDAIGDFPDGESLFVDGQPSEGIMAVLDFCEQFESAVQRTSTFLEDLTKFNLLKDEEISIQSDEFEQPFVFRDFQTVDEEKLRELGTDDLRRMNQSGTLAFIYAHLFSLPQMRSLFSLQMEQGKIPPTRAGRFYVHTPGHRGHPPGTIPFKIGGNPAFGTGQHATTAGCLSALDLLESNGSKFANIADVGTGTGLLAFAALALWPEARCTATDIDPAAIESAKDNAALNDVKVGDGEGEVFLEVADGMASPTVAGRAPFDLIVANILAEYLIGLAPDFAKSLAPGGTLMFAGIIERQVDDVVAAYEKLGIVVTDRGSGDWPVLMLTSPA